MHTQTGPRVRFAPSPTGHLHIGGLRAALFNWLFARHNNGVFLLRIEDTDPERSKPEYTQAILDAFEWVTITPDEPIIIQSTRIAEHQRVAHALIEQGKAYYCSCSSEEVVERFLQKNPGALHVRYDGKCRNLTKQDHGNKQCVIRFKIPATVPDVITFDDLIRGPLSFESGIFDDFIIVRSDGYPMYNFVVVVDDAAAHITHVIRGEDHISNTPKQILLYQACGYTLPRFGHLPMILGPSGDRLSKRDAATSVLDYKQEGFLPDALINYLVRLGWSHGDQEIFSRKELIELFSLEVVGKKGAIFDMEKLRWVNSMYLRAMSATEIHNYITTVLHIPLAQRCISWSSEQLHRSIELYKDRVHTLAEMLRNIQILHDGPTEYDSKSRAIWITLNTPHYLQRVLDLLKTLSSIDHETIAMMLKNMSKELGCKLTDIAQPVRIALIGQSDGPGVFDLMSVLGVQVCVERIKKFMTTIKE